ncbi:MULTISPECIES: DUF3592 domain-containing protein [Streptomyces]|nr:MULTISPECIES: DUF3592 domain-containing protein [Streptomyces]MBH5131206.1 hypothetical protein [Streptomyces sp. HB-N217]WSU01924.1 hypothetical protein OG368_15460 [Streptomyces sp. NBC_01124]
MASAYLAASGSAYFLPHTLVLLGCSGVMAFMAQRAFAVRARGVRVAGVCVRHTFAKDGVAVIVRYEVASGEKFTCLSRPAAVACARVGEPVDVVYDPRRPKNAEVPPIGYGMAVMLSVLALVLGVPGLVLLGWIVGG